MFKDTVKVYNAGNCIVVDEITKSEPDKEILSRRRIFAKQHITSIVVRADVVTLFNYTDDSHEWQFGNDPQIPKLITREAAQDFARRLYKAWNPGEMLEID